MHTGIWIRAGITDMLRGFIGLAAMGQTALQDDPKPEKCHRRIKGKRSCRGGCEKFAQKSSKIVP